MNQQNSKDLKLRNVRFKQQSNYDKALLCVFKVKKTKHRVASEDCLQDK